MFMLFWPNFQGHHSPVLVELPTFPQLFHAILMEALIFIKPPEVYRHADVYYWVNIVATLAVLPVHVNFT